MPRSGCGTQMGPPGKGEDAAHPQRGQHLGFLVVSLFSRPRATGCSLEAHSTRVFLVDCAKHINSSHFSQWTKAQVTSENTGNTCDICWPLLLNAHPGLEGSIPASGSSRPPSSPSPASGQTGCEAITRVKAPGSRLRCGRDHSAPAALLGSATPAAVGDSLLPGPTPAAAAKPHPGTAPPSVL